MDFSVITLFPEMIRAVTDFGITGRAVDNGIVRINCVNPRDFTTDVHRTVDDRPFGGGPGMVMKFEPLQKAIRAAREALPDAKVLYMTPQGRPLDQEGVQELGQSRSLVLLAGRYEGIDERLIEQEVDQEWSIGDYVISGGELAAMVLIDAVTRQLPGVLGHEQSAQEDSFVDGLLDCPQYTRPEVTVDGSKVPEVLLSGDHEAIRRWRLMKSLGRTWQKRPDLLKGRKLTEEQKALLEEFKKTI
ncbi:MAG: tRNA (guanosine(37)-N1)-methyltransferase TrmD [Gammaproteobacteria bacterium]|nr:tRNA (guanosine(37)-N1)-methyltransferase TrmD [Gammaproteobacteria bacterium]